MERSDIRGGPRRRTAGSRIARRAIRATLACGKNGETMAGYIALVHKDEGTSYGVSFPDVPGCISAGDTFEEAVANAAEALAGHLALMRADGDPIPAPRSFEDLKGDREFLADAADAIVTVVQPQRMPADA